MHWVDFLHADSDAIIFGYTDILSVFFEFEMLGVHCSCTCWKPTSM